ncbi:hypothetical protein ACGFYQ_17145 [Streptomyces sp. NPDC048258]|uniref:hypothetical protein n=1 Tax=Streptomyces sp. NPDC048258 TaxID=3365527 RepID=UPI0037180AFB
MSGYLLTASGRTVARTQSAPALPARQAASAPARAGVSLRVEAEGSPYDAWRLHLPDPAAAPPRVLHEIAEILAQYRDGQTRRTARERAAGQELIALLEGAPADPGGLEEALGAAGLPAGGPYRALAATSGDALAEALAHLEGVPYAVGRSAAVLYEDPGAGAGAGADATAGLRAAWPLLRACGGPEADLRLGIGAPGTRAEELRASLTQARFALTAADEEVPVRGVEQLDTLAELLAGVPPEVRTVFGARTLGALGDGMLRETLESSWRTTAPGRVRRRPCTCT